MTFENKCFDDLCDYYREQYACQAKYVDGRKVAGLRSWDTVRGQIEVVRAYFAGRLLRSITYEDLRRFKIDRLNAPLVWVARSVERLEEQRIAAREKGDLQAATECEEQLLDLQKKRRSIASVNRELALLSRMFGVAARQQWIRANPFVHGEKLISSADEKQRMRIISLEEEKRLLSACAESKNPYLRPIVICALDTGMRQGEIFKLVWGDVDFERQFITIRAFNTKTMTAREVAMTPRLQLELRKLGGKRPESERVFRVSDNVKKSFATARKAAGLEEVRFHDLRHTTASRLASGGLNINHVGRLLGHTQPRTTYRYINANEDTAMAAAKILSTSWSGQKDGVSVQGFEPVLPPAVEFPS